ncbi:hypothetical protein D3C78_774360 [compost metagenome]
MSDQALEPGDCRADIQRRGDADHPADQGTDHADHGPLDHEDGHDLPRGRTQGTQDGDIALLVVDHHHQGGNDVERRHRHDQQQQQADHGLFHADRLVQVAVGTGPVTAVELLVTQALGDVPGHPRRLEQVVELQAQALDLVGFPAVQTRQVRQVGKPQVAVDFTGADMEDADHGKALHAREHAGGGHGDLRGDEGQLVADADTQLGRRLVTDHDAELTRRQGVELTFTDEVVDDRDLPLLGRVDAVEQHLLHLAVMGQQALHLGKGCHRHNLRVLLYLLGKGGPVADRLSAFKGGMGHHAQYPGAHLVIETVHDRQHHDHHHHAQGEADHRGQGNERDEVVATLGTGITRADEYEERSEHVGACSDERGTSLWRGLNSSFTLRPPPLPWVRHVDIR